MDAKVDRRHRSPVMSSVMHAIEVLRCLASAARPLGVTEVARRIGLHKSTVSRLLVTLEQAHLVEREQPINRFRLGVGLISLAAPLMTETSLIELARPILEEVAEETGETVSLNVWDGTAAVSVLQVPGANAVKHFAPLGMCNPSHCTAAGKVLLAHLPEDSITFALSGRLPTYTPMTKVNADELRRELQEIRRTRYALNEGELEADVGAVASTVQDSGGSIRGAIVATVPMYRFVDPHKANLIIAVTTAARRISRRLGAGPER